MLIYPSVRVQGNENTVWQRITSNDNYTYDVGMKPTEMFMRFNETEFLSYDGSDFEVTADANIIGTLKVTGDGSTVPGYYLYNSSGDSVGGFYEASSNAYLFGTNRLTLSGPSSNSIVLTSTGVSLNKPVTMSGLASDDTEDHVVAIDDSTGLMTKRSVASILAEVPTPTSIYGSMYADDATITVTITDPATYYQVDGALGEGYCVAVSFQNDNELLIEEAGYYEVNWSMSFTCASNNQLIKGSVLINGMYSDRCVGARFVATGADLGNMGGTGIIHLQQNDVVTMGVYNYTSNANVTIGQLNVVIRKL